MHRAPGGFGSALLVAGVLSQVPSPAQKSVSVHVAVTDAELTRPVRGLTASDFEVLIDDAPARIETFESGAPSLALVTLFDVSASVDFRTLELSKDFSSDIEHDLLPPLGKDDRFAVGVFGARVSLSGFLPDDRKTRVLTAQKAFKDRSIGLNGPSRIWDAADEAVTALAGERGRRAIVLVTDGEASGNRVGLDDLIRHAQTADVAVCVIASGSPASNPKGAWAVTNATPDALLRRLAGETGGLFVIDEVGDQFRPRKPGRFFSPLVEALRQTYTLGIRAPDANSSHRLDVRVRQGGDVHVRASW
jgi:VWFA-related protein